MRGEVVAGSQALRAVEPFVAIAIEPLDQRQIDLRPLNRWSLPRRRNRHLRLGCQRRCRQQEGEENYETSQHGVPSTRELRDRTPIIVRGAQLTSVGSSAENTRSVEESSGKAGHYQTPSPPMSILDI